VLALLGFILVRALDRVWGRIQLGGLRIPEGLATLLSALLITALGLGMVRLITANASGVAAAAPTYQARLLELIEKVDIDLPFWEAAEEEGTPTLVDRLANKIDVPSLARNLVSQLAGIVGNASLVLIYLFFLILERPFFEAKLRRIFPDDDRRQEMREILGRIDHDVSTYLGLKSFVSLLTALPSYVVLRWVGVDFAEFWGILIFVLNFIPNVGSLVATLLPSAIALVQFPTTGPFLTVAITVVVIQLAVANLIEPSLLGRRLNMSPLVVIVALVAWSLMWGIAGAFLCVPMTTIMIIVLANIRSTSWLAILLSRDGQIRHPDAPGGEAPYL